MKILFIGDLWKGSTALQRLNAMKELHHCDQIDSTPEINSIWDKYLQMIVIKLRWYLDLAGLNDRILYQVSNNKYDIVWIEKGMRVYPGTLKKIKQLLPACKIISFSPDDMHNPLNQSIWYNRSIGVYDLHVTTKSYNVPELKKLGAKKVFFVDKSFDPGIHRKMKLSSGDIGKYGCDVGFIGSWEKDRFLHLLFLAQSGIKVTIRGETWKKYTQLHPNLVIIPKNEWAEEYAKVLNATKINLCFLKKLNRDLQTARSIEIPACGGFMLAERTEEHQRLFREDVEAVFFSSKEELVEKVRYYFNNDAEREKIALEGYQRCLVSGYDNTSMLLKVFQFIEINTYADSQVV